MLEDPCKSYHVKQRVTDHDLFDDNLLAHKELEQELAGMVNCKSSAGSPSSGRYGLASAHSHLSLIAHSPKGYQYERSVFFPLAAQLISKAQITWH